MSTDSSVFILYKIVLYFTFSFLRKERDLSKEAKKKFRNSSSVLSWGPQARNALKHTNLIRIRIRALPLKSTKYSSWSFKYKIPGSYLSSLLWMEFWFFFFNHLRRCWFFMNMEIPWFVFPLDTNISKWPQDSCMNYEKDTGLSMMTFKFML